MKALAEGDIRPPEFSDGQKAALQADIEYLKARTKAFVTVDCPACGTSGDTHWEKNDFLYQRCPSCSTVFMNPRPSEELLKEFYRDSVNYAYWNKYIFPASESARREKIFVPRVVKINELAAKLNVGTSALLEIGAGFGTFCDEMQVRGRFKRVVGLEITPDLANTCRNRGLEVVDCFSTLSEITDDGFDVIVAFEVLEHVFDPYDFLLTAAGFLKNNGLLVLSCPNIEGFDVMTLGPDSDVVDHEHLNYFNPRSIRTLLERIRLIVHDVHTPGKLDADIVRNKAIKGQTSLANAPFLRHVLLDNWEQYGEGFQSYLANAGLSSHMWAVSQKL